MLYLQSRATELVTDNDLGPDWLLELETKVQVLKIFTITEKVSGKSPTTRAKFHVYLPWVNAYLA